MLFDNVYYPNISIQTRAYAVKLKYTCVARFLPNFDKRSVLTVCDSVHLLNPNFFSILSTMT